MHRPSQAVNELSLPTVEKR